MDERLLRPNWTALKQAEREALLRQIGERYQMQLEEFAHFSRWGLSLDTAVYSYEGSEFVFIPGDTVTLGWDEFVQGMDQHTAVAFALDLDEDFGWEEDDEEELDEDEDGYPNIEVGEEMRSEIHKFLRSCMTEVRQAKIGPMLVERWMQETCYYPAALEDPEIAGNPEYQTKIAQIEKGELNGCTIHQEVRFTRTKQRCKVDRYQGVNAKEQRALVEQQGFCLPTVDEWEYICGGGCRTLYVCGDSFDLSLVPEHYMQAHREADELPHQPNGFGLYIGYDPYQRELALDSAGEFVFKGGDGGCFVCGGSSCELGMLPSCAPYFKGFEEDGPVDELHGDYDFVRRILRIE